MLRVEIDRERDFSTMLTNFSLTEILFLLLAALVSIHHFNSNPIAQRSKFFHHRRSSLPSNARILRIPSSMVLTNLFQAWNTDVVDASPKGYVPPASCSNSVTEDSEPVAASKKGKTNTSPLSVEGIELPGHRVVDGETLLRNGHGLRSITYFGIGIRIYVAAMYSVEPILSVEQVMESSPDLTSTPASGPLQLDFTFLRYVRQSQVVSAWTQQLDYSVTHRDYEGYEADRDRFIELASGGPIEKFGTQSVQLVGDETRIIDQGKVTGTIHGRNFQQSFLSMWFGSKAVAEDLKANLLRGDEHHPEDIEKMHEKLQQEASKVLIEA